MVSPAGSRRWFGTFAFAPPAARRSPPAVGRAAPARSASDGSPSARAPARVRRQVKCPVPALTGLRVANITCICGWMEASRSAAATCTASSCRLRSSSHAADADGLSAPACAGPSSKMTLTPVPIRDLTAVACAMPRLSATTSSLSTAACVSVASRHAEALLSRYSSSPPDNHVLCHHLWSTQRGAFADAHDPASAWATMSRIGTRRRPQIDAAGSSGLRAGQAA